MRRVLCKLFTAHVGNIHYSFKEAELKMKFILVMQYIVLTSAAIIPEVLSKPAAADIINHYKANETIFFRTHSNVSAIDVITRKLVEHRDVVRIAYKYTAPFLSPLYQQSLAVAHHRIKALRDVEGDAGIVDIPIAVIIENTVVVANQDRYTATPELTWGALEEAVRVLRAFMQTRPYELAVQILEGDDGKGPPLGEITVMTLHHHLAGK
ncbi:MAG: hypothetical protein Q9201_007010 [Fulgogasparrea decipioides]